MNEYCFLPVSCVYLSCRGVACRPVFFVECFVFDVEFFLAVTRNVNYVSIIYIYVSDTAFLTEIRY
jgi:hypothetical protein